MDYEYFEALYPENVHEDALSKLTAFVKEGASAQLLGLPGSGRSTLLHLLTYNRNIRTHHFGQEQKTMHFVLVNFSEVRTRSLHDVM